VEVTGQRYQSYQSSASSFNGVMARQCGGNGAQLAAGGV